MRLFLVVLLLVFVVGPVTGGKTDFFRFNGSSDLGARSRAEAQVDKVKFQFGARRFDAAGDWFRPRLKAVLRDPERFKLVLESQSERFAFLTLPLVTILLALFFVFQRRFFLFDHTIFAPHSLSFQGLLYCLSAVSGRLWNPLSAVLLAAPIHLFLHMRGVYRTSLAGTLLRMTLPGILSGLGFLILVLLLVLVGLSAMA